MHEETDDMGRRVHTVAAIVAELGVTQPTIYRHPPSSPATAHADTGEILLTTRRVLKH